MTTVIEAGEVEIPVVRRRWRGTVLAATALVLVAGVGSAAALGRFGGGGGDTPAVSDLPPATGEVTRTTLVATEDFDGTLGYGDTSVVSVLGASPDGAAGVITWLPGVGKTIERGETVYSTNAEPVVLMYGSMPFFRQLTDGDSGVDVEQLEENLSELGYEGFTVDDEYTSATADVVSQWQDDLGVEETGVFDPARVVVSPGAFRIADQLTALGNTGSGEVLSYTDTSQVITVELDVADQQLVAEDLPVTVELPDGSTVDATVTSVGTVATSSEEGDSGNLAQQDTEDGTTTIEVIITVDDSDALDGWDAAPVEVRLEVDRREDVLVVPVGALVALAEGGYGVQVVDGSQTSYVAVETGLFADGMVEVAGEGIAEGMVVGVPS